MDKTVAAPYGTNFNAGCDAPDHAMSAAPKFTPGPWQVYGPTGVHFCAGKKTLGLVHTKSAEESEQAKANARLIAAAPELYEALRECMSCMDSLRDFVSEGGSIHMVGAKQAVIDADAAFDAARAALAKVQS